MIVGRAIYRNGRRIDGPDDIAGLSAACDDPDTVVWLGLHAPTPEEFVEVAEAFDLHVLSVEDAVLDHQRPKFEQFGTTRFLVLRSARYIDESETVEFGEVHVFAGPGFVLTVRHGDASQLRGVRQALESRPDLLALGPLAIVHAIVDRIVDDYVPVVEGIENDIDEIEDDVFDGRVRASRRIYELTREVIKFQRATLPLPDMLERLMIAEGVSEEERRYLRDVHDHALKVREQAASFRALLQNILNVNLTLETKALSEASIAQAEEVKKISAWAAILFAPTLVGTIYGMNFDHMPELGWKLGYPLSIVMMLMVGVALWGVFRFRRWI